MKLIGLEEQKAAFQKVISEGNLRHAYVLYGDEGIGKFLLGKWIAEYIERGSSTKDEGRTLSDALFIEPDEKGSLRLEHALRVRNFLWETPLVSQKRVVVIRDAHTLTREAEGSLLKIVEEPPLHACIICTTHMPETLIAPLKSRLIKVYCKRMEEKMLTKTLEKMYEITAVKAQAIAKRSCGRIGRAIRLLEKKSSDITYDEFLIEKIFQAREKGVEASKGILKELLKKSGEREKWNINENIQKKDTEWKIRRVGL
jgi:DNA polymerase-3 subunit delta'